MKLALIRRHFSATGGAELYLQRLLAALAQAGHELHLFAEAWTGNLAGVTMHPVTVSGSRATRASAFAGQVAELLRGERFDCIFSLERTWGQDVYRAGDGVHRVWLERRRQFAPWWRKPFLGAGAFHRVMADLEARTFDPRNTRRIIVNSTMVKDEILRHFAFPADRIHLVRNGVETQRFQAGNRAETRARLGVADDEFLLLFVGSGWERKGLKFLLSALGRPELACNRIKLLVVGKGRPPAGAPANVIFAGAMTDVENAYAAADLFTFLPIYEPSSNVVVEALAAGLPVITSAQNGASEWIEPGASGTVIADPTAAAAVAQAIVYLQGRGRLPVKNLAELDLLRNVAETLAILELAAQDRVEAAR